MGKTLTNDELSDGRSILLDYDSRQGKRAAPRTNHSEDRDGCTERNVRGPLPLLFDNEWEGVQYHRFRLPS